MNRPFLAALVGALPVLLLFAVPLWRQGARLETGASPRVSRSVAAKSPRPAPLAPGAAKAHDLLRAEADAAPLTAEQCRAALEAAVAAGKTEALLAPMCRWAELDGAAAFAWLEEHNELMQHVTPDAISVWAAADPQGCAVWMEKLATLLRGGGTDPPWLIESSPWRTLLQNDLRAAIRVVGNLCADGGIGAPISRNDLRPALRTVADAEAVGAEILAHPEWLAGKPGETPLYLLVALRECWQEMDPAGWDRWAAAHPEAAAKSANEPIRPGLKFLRSPDRAAAASELLAAVPPEELAKTSADLIRVWDDMEASGQWLNTLPEGPVKNAAAQAYALESAKENPQAAFQWAATITDPAARARTQRRVFTAWHDADPAAAAAWLPQSGWSGAQQQAARDIMATAPVPAPGSQ